MQAREVQGERKKAMKKPKPIWCLVDENDHIVRYFYTKASAYKAAFMSTVVKYVPVIPVKPKGKRK